MSIFSNFPIFIIALAAAIIGGAVVPVVRKWVALHLLTSHHEVAFPIFLQIGVIYAVLLAFIFSMVLSDTDDAYIQVKRETTNLLTLAQLAPGFSDNTALVIDNTLLEYTHAVIEKEWPKMAQRQEEKEVSRILAKLQNIYLNLNIQTMRDQALYAESLSHLSQLRENRRMRIFTAIEPRLENPLALLSILGAIVIAISYFFGMKNLWTQMLLTGALIFCIVSILMVIHMSSNPFSGKFAIKTDVFANALVRLEQISKENHT